MGAGQSADGGAEVYELLEEAVSWWEGRMFWTSWDVDGGG